MKQFIQDNRQAAKQTIIILSAELSTRTKESNRMRTDDLYNRLFNANIPFEKAIGSYKGIQEASFVCKPRHAEDEETIRHLAFNYFSQESILIRHLDKVVLLFKDGFNCIGSEIVSVPEHAAIKEDAYTIVNNRYYVVR